MLRLETNSYLPSSILPFFVFSRPCQPKGRLGTETCPSGWRSSLGKRVNGKLFRGFESLSLREKWSQFAVFQLIAIFLLHFSPPVVHHLQKSGKNCMNKGATKWKNQEVVIMSRCKTLPFTKKRINCIQNLHQCYLDLAEVNWWHCDESYLELRK